MTDGQTDGRTDGRTELRWLRRAEVRAAFAQLLSCVKTGTVVTPNLGKRYSHTIFKIILLRARANIAERISCLGVCLGVLVFWCLSQPGTDRSPCEIDFRCSPYNSLESLVFCDKVSCHWVKGVPTNEG